MARSGTSIETVAVIGAGVMGAAIAAHVANAGTKVLLLDIRGSVCRDRIFCCFADSGYSRYST